MVMLLKEGDKSYINQAYQSIFPISQTVNTDISKTKWKRFLMETNQENRLVSEMVTRQLIGYIDFEKAVDSIKHEAKQKWTLAGPPPPPPPPPLPPLSPTAIQ